jgi:hypothetical protein
MLDELGLRCIKQVGIDDWRDWDSDPLGFGATLAGPGSGLVGPHLGAWEVHSSYDAKRDH